MNLMKAFSFLAVTSMLVLGVACSSTKKQEDAPVAAVEAPAPVPEAPAPVTTEKTNSNLNLGTSSSGQGH